MAVNSSQLSSSVSFFKSPFSSNSPVSVTRGECVAASSRSYSRSGFEGSAAPIAHLRTHSGDGT